MATEENLCASCGKPAPSVCGRCKATFYCGATCQKSHYKQHRPVCENSDLEKHIYRAGKLLQEFILAWAEKTWMAKVGRIEYQNNALQLHIDTASPTLQSDTLISKFPDHLFPTQHDKRMALCVNKCDIVLAYFKRVVDELLKGTPCRLSELWVTLKLASKHAYIVSPVHPPKCSHRHLVTILRSSASSKTWVLDPTGLQSGNTSPVLSYDDYMTRFVDEVNGPESPWGTCRSEHCRKSRQFTPLAPRFRLQWITATTAKQALSAWTTSFDVSLPDLLQEPEAEFQDHFQSLLRGVNDALSTAVWASWDMTAYEENSCKNPNSEVYRAAADAMGVGK